MRKPIIAGNWKMNMSIEESKGFVSEFLTLVNDDGAIEKVDICIATPYLQLATVASSLEATPIIVAAQNVSEHDSGAYTGEISSKMLKEVGITTALVGHSERRQYFGDTDESVALKTAKALENSITPIVCIGETKEERESNKTKDVIKKQVLAVFSKVDDATKIIIAYEPVWAIGTGLTATSEQAQEVHAFIRSLVKERYGEAASEKVRILYGGSANPKNIEELLSQPDIDGGLVGGASLKADSFSQMVLIAAK